LGGYDPTPVTLTEDAGGNAVDPVEMKPGLSGAGLSVQSAGAITDYNGLAAVRGTSPDDAVIDAVRVKVDAAGSWADAAGRIDAAAAAIKDLGLDVQIVAGSAREDVSIYVPEYRQDASGEVSDLGTVSQSWVRQGAASAVQTSLSQASSVLLMLTLGGAALLTAASTVAFTRARRTEAVTLRAMGWTRPKIRSWFLSELLIGAAALLAVAVIVNAFSRTMTTLLVSAVVLVIYLAAAFVSTALLKPHPPADTGPQGATGVPLVDSPVRFAARQLSTNRFNTGAVAVGVGVLGAAAGTLVAVILDLPRAAGSTALGALALTEVGGVNIALALLGVVTALVLTLITSRFDLARKREQWDILEAMGWGPGLLLALRRSEAGILAIMALPLAILGAVAASLAVAPHAVFRAVVAGVLAVILWFILMTRTRK